MNGGYKATMSLPTAVRDLGYLSDLSNTNMGSQTDSKQCLAPGYSYLVRFSVLPETSFPPTCLLAQLEICY